MTIADCAEALGNVHNAAGRYCTFLVRTIPAVAGNTP